MQTPRTSYMHGHGGQGLVNRMEACVNELVLLRFCPEISATIAILSWFSSLSLCALSAGWRGCGYDDTPECLYRVVGNT